MTKLIKDTKTIKLPKATSSVERTLRAANKACKEQRWRKVVIIGEGPFGYHLSNSKMTYYTLIGFLEHGKLEIDREASE